MKGIRCELGGHVKTYLRSTKHGSRRVVPIRSLCRGCHSDGRGRSGLDNRGGVDQTEADDGDGDVEEENGEHLDRCGRRGSWLIVGVCVIELG